MLHIGMWTSYFIDLSPEDMVTTFARKGWYHLELSDEHGKALLDRGTSPEATGRSFRKYAADHNVVFPQGHLWLTCNITADDGGKTLDALKRWLDLFNAIGITAAVLHPAGGPMSKPGTTPEGFSEKNIAALRILTDHIAGTPLKISLENGGSAEPLLAMINAVGDNNLGICLDTGHLNLFKGDPAEFIRKAGKHLTALHIADNEGQNDQHLMPFGRGKVPWKSFIDAVKQIGYQGLFNLEIPGENMCPITVRLMKLDYIRQTMAYMMNGMD
ncbi:MAG: sugar phosphate isomerase/epimerase [Spirochaetota bacterium]